MFAAERRPRQTQRGRHDGLRLKVNLVPTSSARRHRPAVLEGQRPQVNELITPTGIGRGAISSRSATTSASSTTTMWTQIRSEEHTSELQSLMRISYSVFCLKTKKKQ